MAVRDEQRQDTGESSDSKLPWRDALGQLPTVLIAGGLLLYGYLSVCYYSFYNRLGIDPNDVGLSYTGTLARSSGFVWAYLLAVFFLLPLPSTRRPRSDSRTLERARRVIAVALLALTLGLISGTAQGAAGHVEEGEPVRPVELRLLVLPPLILLAIHADPVHVEPAGKPGDFPAVERLQEHDLLYLGQSTGTVVLYNSTTQEAVYVPASSIVLHVGDAQ
jgi:hypothetical protein